MHDFSNEMRAVRGPGFLAALAAERITGDAVVSGLRNVFETEILKERFGDSYTLVALEAPMEPQAPTWTSGFQVNSRQSLRQHL